MNESMRTSTRHPSRAPATHGRWRDPAWHLAVLLTVAIACGGGGVGAGMANLVVQFAALVVMALNRRAFAAFFLRKPDGLTILVVVSVLLPLAQLVPLPPSIWVPLPGRDMVAASLAHAGGVGWYPLSLDMGRTLTAAIGTITPLVIVAVGSVLPPARLYWLAKIVIAVGAATMLFGAAHLLNPDFGNLYRGPGTLPMHGMLLGTFADRNACAVFLNGCLLLLIGLPRERAGKAVPWLSLVDGVLLALGVVLTQSRTGIVLLAIPAALMAFKFLVYRRNRGESATTQGRPKYPLVVAALVAVLALGAAGAMSDGRIAASLARFDGAGDGKRAEMREDALSAAKHYWPVGAGLGTFDEVFQVDESLEFLSPRPAGRAHMDYYELAIEAGLAGLLLAAGWLAWILLASWSALRRSDLMALAGSGFVLCIAAQSLLSFPLRNQTILAFFALVIVLLRHPANRERAKP